ncbi:glucose-1-phosphate thymidylyltransferase [Chitinophaga pendula]|uniref:putative sugar nucleotidyl transferase n=1 Tax=Chitinophaga TaxID=79328 RepID=UPI000BAF2CE6|nr:MULTISPECIES: putative sugar nucleotidyl transferase [Chitinophaga]ASZ13960.1 glucose-1-phosphate thymidylyltransferase [Chitinophaga sp. MD30]UCJ08417.1 glucose-1-phosphate thymidylyltransferase [Chitinophaga pendula]
MERNYILIDTPGRDLLFPFTYTRPIAACRVGILTVQQKWEHRLKTPVSHFTADYLQQKFPLKKVENAVNILINGHILPDDPLISKVQSLAIGEELYKDNNLIAKVVEGNDLKAPVHRKRTNYKGEILSIDLPWHITALNDKAIRQDFDLLTRGRTSHPLPPGNQLIGDPAQLFIEEGASIEHCCLNTSTGPIYIGHNALLMEGSLVRGPLAIADDAVLKMGTKIYGATTIGPACIVGGEIKNVVLFGYSNKAHDGYLGDAVIGEWCNLGANTSGSNMKNNGSTVKVWMEAKNEAWPAGQKCGLLMGDYSRAGIHTMFNTGTVVSVSCNVFGGSFPPKFLPAFTWGGTGNVNERYRLEEALRDAATWMSFKGKAISSADILILKHIYNLGDSEK